MKINEQSYAFALLIFGQLGDSARISLQSILRNSSSKICIGGDRAGLNWAISQVPEVDKSRLCIHSIPRKYLQAFGLDGSENYMYSNFGQERFIKLTTFKWYLLHSVLTQHKQLDLVVFSDLDVIWLSPPTQKLGTCNIDNNLALIQDDTPQGAKYKHFCTGIMFWFNKVESIQALAELYAQQFMQNNTGALIPDEPTFNRWYESRNSINKISVLPTESFVIGHKYFKFIISRNHTFQNLTAFHANYVIGEKAKYRRLRSFELRCIGHKSWYILTLNEFARRLFSPLISFMK